VDLAALLPAMRPNTELMFACPLATVEELRVASAAYNFNAKMDQEQRMK
jgi:hypothetical protein